MIHSGASPFVRGSACPTDLFRTEEYSDEVASMDARRSQSSTDGRRRRLLHSQDTEELLAEFEALAPGSAAAAVSQVTVAVPDRQLLTRLVSSQLWKHGILVFCIVLLGVAAIWGEVCQPDTLRELADSRQPRVSKGLAGAFLIVSGQLALLIAWIRSGSSVDFSGRYRCWKWLAGCLMSIGVLWVTNFQNSLPQLARLFIEPVIGGVGAARHTLVVVPLAALSVWVLSRVVPDMGRCRWTQAMFCLGVLTALGRLLLSYGNSIGEVTDAVLDGVLLAATGLLVCSLMLHARFVLYVSKDPPEQTAGQPDRKSLELDEADVEPAVIVPVRKQESAPVRGSQGTKAKRRRKKSPSRRAA